MSTIESIYKKVSDGNNLYDVVRDKTETHHMLLSPYVLLISTVFLGSMVILALYSFQPTNTFTLADWTVSNYVEISRGDLYKKFLFNSFRIGVITTGISLLICYPAAYALGRKITRFRRPILMLLIMPLLTSVVMRVYGWTVFLVKDGITSTLYSTLLSGSMPSLLYTEGATILGTTYIYLPFMLFPIYLSIVNINPSVIEAACDLGAGKLVTFRRIILPQSKPGIIIGILFVFILSMGAEIEASMLGGNAIATVATDINRSFGFVQDWPMGSAKAMLLLTVSLVAGVVILRIVNLEEIAVRSGGANETTDQHTSRAESAVWYGYVLLIVAFLNLPIAGVIAASFYDGVAFTFPYKFTFESYTAAVTSGAVYDAVSTSIKIVIPVTILSTLIGGAAGIGYARYHFRGREVFKIGALLPIFFPLLLTGLSMSLWFDLLGIQRGILATILGHTTWMSPIVMFIVVLKAIAIDPHVEEAAKDLGAGAYTQYKKITLPLISNGLISGALFAFILSWNNYYISAYLSGPTDTVTTWIRGQIAFGYDPIVSAFTAMIIYSIIPFIIIAFILEIKTGESD